MSADRPTGGGQGLSELVEAAHAEIARLCTPGERWRMTIPADPRRDSDLILSDALDRLAARADKDAAAVAAVRALCAQREKEFAGSIPLHWSAANEPMVTTADVLAALDVASPTADPTYPEPEKGTTADLTTPLFEQSADIDFEPTADLDTDSTPRDE